MYHKEEALGGGVVTLSPRGYGAWGRWDSLGAGMGFGF